MNLQGMLASARDRVAAWRRAAMPIDDAAGDATPTVGRGLPHVAAALEVDIVGLDESTVAARCAVKAQEWRCLIDTMPARAACEAVTSPEAAALAKLTGVHDLRATRAVAERVLASAVTSRWSATLSDLAQLLRTSDLAYAIEQAVGIVQDPEAYAIERCHGHWASDGPIAKEIRAEVAASLDAYCQHKLNALDAQWERYVGTVRAKLTELIVFMSNDATDLGADGETAAHIAKSIATALSAPSPRPDE